MQSVGCSGTKLKTKFISLYKTSQGFHNINGSISGKLVRKEVSTITVQKKIIVKGGDTSLRKSLRRLQPLFNTIERK